MEYKTNTKKPTFRVVTKLRLLNHLQQNGHFPIKTEKDKFDETGQKVIWVFLNSDSLNEEIERYYHSEEFLNAQK